MDTQLLQTAMPIVAQTEAQIDYALGLAREAALVAGGLLVVRLAMGEGAAHLFIVPAVQVPASKDGPSLNPQGNAAWQASRPSQPSAQPPSLAPEQIHEHVRAALRSYHSTIALGSNSLVNLLDLQRFRHESDRSSLAKGLSLRRTLDAAVQALKDSPARKDHELAQYFYIRYRHRAEQQDVARELRISPRTAQRLNEALVQRVSELLLQM